MLLLTGMKAGDEPPELMGRAELIAPAMSDHPVSQTGHARGTSEAKVTGAYIS